MIYSPEIQILIEEFSKFPSVGPKTAQRFVFYLLRQSPQTIHNLIVNLEKVKSIQTCSICGNFSDQNKCRICRNPNRNQKVVTVVAEPQDLMAVERIGDYHGTYHILGGLLDPTRQVGPKQLRVNELVLRLKKFKAQEVILVLNSTIKGEATALYLKNIIRKTPELKQIKITKIARGLPLGAEIEYADEITLSDAFKGRKQA